MRHCQLEIDRHRLEEGTSQLRPGKDCNPIVLPLLPHVGNSLFDYIRNERDNEAGSVYLFPQQEECDRKVGEQSIGTIVNTVFEKLNLVKR